MTDAQKKVLDRSLPISDAKDYHAQSFKVVFVLRVIFESINCRPFRIRCSRFQSLSNLPPFPKSDAPINPPLFQKIARASKSNETMKDEMPETPEREMIGGSKLPGQLPPTSAEGQGPSLHYPTAFYCALQLPTTLR